MPINTPKRSRALSWLLIATSFATLVGCTHRSVDSTDTGPLQDAAQLVLVTVPDWDSPGGTLRSFERDGDGWRAVAAPQPVTIGRAGAAWGLGLHDAQASGAASGPVKREGDGRAPAGVFAIGEAFGYAVSADTGLPYLPMRASHYCIDVADSPLYNRIVDAREVGQAAVASSTEPMRRDIHVDGDQRYRLGFVIEHNTQAQPGAGSCIFAHLWKAADVATAGCTAMDPAAMETLLAWLRPERRPVFVLLPQEEFARLRDDWHLPELDARR